MTKILTLRQIATLVSGELLGDPETPIHAVAPLSSAKSGELSWVQNDKHAKQLAHCQASAVLIGRDQKPGSLAAIVCDKPALAIARVLAEFQPHAPPPPVGIHPTAIVADGAKIAASASIGPQAVIQSEACIDERSVIHAGVFIGENCSIGQDCLIWPNVVIRERCTIGHRVIIHPNATIGADGFGYNFEQGTFQKIPHIGSVRIEDDVEIGANTCIDRAKIGETLIGRGTKIDNLVQIAHNVHIGEHCCIIAHAGIAGSARLGHHVTLAGKVGIKDNIALGNGVQVAACSCVAGDVPDGEIMLGNPASPKHEFFREMSAMKRLTKTTQQVKELLKRVETLEAANHQKNG